MSASSPGSGSTCSTASIVAPPAKTLMQREHLLIAFVQEVVAPVDRSAQGLLALREVTRAAGQQCQPIVQAGQDRLRSQQLHAGCGQLDGQRQAVEPNADLDHGRGVVRDSA